MRILHVSSPLYSIPPKAYGGMERIVEYLIDAQIRTGHKITVLAPGDSQIKAELIPYPKSILQVQDAFIYRDPEVYKAHFQYHNIVQKTAHLFDLVHVHFDPFWLPIFLDKIKFPLVFTVHNYIRKSQALWFRKHMKEVYYIAISHAQRNRLPEMPWYSTILDGMPKDLLIYEPNPKGYILFLGRICHEKGFDIAFRIARKTGYKMLVASKFRRGKTYFDMAEKAMSLAENVTFLGEITQEQKQNIVGHADALLFPIRWEEPFGLVMIEALATGTPVLACPRGAVPEIIQDKVNGILFESEEEGCQALEKIPTIDRRICRETFEKSFTVDRMVDEYTKVYERILHERKVS
jgi:glycosyltransferase involved in cell wall biosynthesis